MDTSKLIDERLGDYKLPVDMSPGINLRLQYSIPGVEHTYNVECNMREADLFALENPETGHGVSATAAFADIIAEMLSRVRQSAKMDAAE